MSISLEWLMLDTRAWKAEIEQNLFPKSLIGTTMQDGG